MGPIQDAAATNDRRATLVAMRDKLAADMDEAPPAVVAQIAGRLAAVLEEIDGLPDTQKVSPLDELDRRRQDRISAASG
jgi:hypothetical protein